MTSFISSIGTAVPQNRIKQSDISAFMQRHLPLSEPQKKNLKLLYRASGIHYRHSVIADYGQRPAGFQFYPANEELEPFPQVGQRMQLYKEEAIKLCMDAVNACARQEQLQSVTHLITVSCTGMYAPGIDIELIERLNMATDIQRTSINFMGCYAAFNALKVADHILRSNEDSKVLIVDVELCSIHLLKQVDDDSLLSNTLFGDGAAAVFLESSTAPEFRALELCAFHADLDTSGKEAMAWHINDFGFEMKLSKEVPDIIQKGIGKLSTRLLDKLGMRIEEVDHFAIHPGGKRILQVIEQALGLTKTHNEPAYHVLKNYGNMSSPTVLFVLKHVMDGVSIDDIDKNILSFAFGPGLTMESLLLKIH